MAAKVLRTTEALEQRALKRRGLRAITRNRFGQTVQHAVGRRLQSLEEQIRPSVLHVIREAAGNKDNGVVAVA